MKNHKDIGNFGDEYRNYIENRVQTMKFSNADIQKLMSEITPSITISKFVKRFIQKKN